MPQPSESSVVSNLSRPTKSSPLASEARLGLHDVRVDFSISKVPLPFLKEIIDGKNGSWVHPQRAHFWRSLGLLKKARRGPFLIVNAPFGAAESLQDLGFSLSLLSANTEANIFRQALRAFQAKPTDFLFVDDKVATEASFYEAMTAVPFGLMVFLLEQESSSVRCFSIPTHVPIESIAQYWPTVPRLISVVEASQQHLLTLQKQFQLGADAARISFGFRRPNLSFEVAFLPPDEREKALLSTLSSPDSLPAKVVFADEKQAHRISSILKKELPVALAKCCITDRPTYRIEEMSTRKPQSAALGAPASQAYIRTLVHLEYPIDKRAYAQDLQDVGFEPVDARSILFADDDDRDQIERRLQRKELPLSLLRSIFLAFPATSTAQCDLDFDGIHQDVLDDAIEILQEVGSIFRDKYSRCHRIFGKDEVADLELLLQQKAQERRDASEAMHAFVNVQSCRMLSWVSHFQDEHDHYQPCGMCDVCAPQNAKVRRQRAMTSMEHDLCFRFFSALNLPCLKDEAVQQGAHLGIPKGWVERFLNGLWRGEVLQGVGEIFRDPNEDRMHLEFIRGPTADAFQKSPANHALFVEVTRCEPVVLKSIETKQSQAKVDVSRRELAAISELLEEEVKKHAPSPETKNLHDLQNRLRAFRKEECRRRQIPAYRVLSNRTLEQLVQTRPQDIDELTQIHGVGPKMIAQYGKRFLELVKEQHASSDAEDAA